MNFWETLPETAYNQWQSNKFKSDALKRLEEMSDDELWGSVGVTPPNRPPNPSAPTTPANPYQQPAGSDTYSTVKKWFGKTVGAGAKALGGAADDQLGLTRGLKSIKTAAEGYKDYVQEPFRGALFYAGPDIIKGNDLTKYGAGENPLEVWRKLGKAAEDSKRSGVVQFGEDLASDPLTYAGGVGKAVGLLGKATHLPALTRAGGAITKVENIPGQAIARGIGKGGQAIYTHAVPEALRRPSTRALTSTKSNEFLDIGRRLLNKAGIDAADIRPTGDAAADAAMLKRQQIALRQIDDFLKHGYSAHLGLSGEMMTEIKGLSPDAVKVLQTGLKARLGDGNARLWLDDVSSHARSAELKRIREGIQLARSTRNSRLDRTLNALEPAREQWQKRIEPIQQAIGKSILGTAGVGVGNVAEDMGRAGEAGVWTGHTAAGRMIRGKHVPSLGVPGTTKSAVNNALDDVPMKYPQLALDGAGSTTAQAMGYGEAPTTLKGKIANVATGGIWTDFANKMSDRVRGEFITKTYQKELAKLTPDITKATLATKRQAMQAAEALFEERFPVGTESNLGYFMKQIYPFWNYETRRWPYLAQLAARRPAVAAGYTHYRDNTDDGYMPTPMKGLQVDPLRASAFGVVDNIADPKDYPTFSSGLSGDIEKFNALTAKAGFYPSTLVGGIQSIIRAAEGQDLEAGMIVPTAQKIQLQALRGSEIPGVSNAAGGILDNVLSNRFDEYAINKMLADQGINPKDATPEQRQEAAAAAARLQALMTQTGVTRWRPEDETAFKKERQQEALKAGVPESAVKQAGKNNPLTVTNPETNERYINSAKLRDVYNENPEWERWQQVAEPLKRPEDKKVQAETDAYYKALDSAKQKRDQELMRLASDWLQDRRDYTSIREERSTILSNFSAVRDQLAKQHPLALVDDQRRADYYTATGRQPLNDRPEDAAARAFYAIAPKIGANSEKDFDAFHNERQAALEAMDPATRKYVESEYVKKEYPNDIIRLFEQDYHEKSNAYQQYLKTPKYDGIDPETTKKIDEAVQQASYLRQMYPDMDSTFINAMLFSVNPEGAAWLPLINRMRNPQRRQMIADNPQLRGFLSRAEQADLLETL